MYNDKHNSPAYQAAIRRNIHRNAMKGADEKRRKALELYPEAVAILDNGLDHKSSFIRDVAERFRSYGSLTEAQAAAVVRTAERFAEPPKPKATEKLETLAPLAVMLEFAKNEGGKKAPRVLFGVKNPEGTGYDVRYKLYFAGPTSKWPGWIQIKEHGGGHRWFGRINPKSGELHKGHDMTPKILESLKEFAADPKQAAMAYGHLMGECCFCAKDLTHESSKELGYGPVCAEKHGLDHSY
jgi:hypothetical protein